MSFYIPRFSLKRLTGLLFAAVGIGLVGVIAAILIASSKFITPKRRVLESRHHEMLTRPADYGLDLEPFVVTTHDGIALSAILATRAKNPGVAEKTRRMAARLGQNFHSAVPRPHGTVIFLHGRGGCKEDMLSIAQRFVAGGYRCLVYDARAHGTSRGVACTYGKHETRDLSAVLDRISVLLEERGEIPGQVCAMGISLGGSVVLQALPNEPRIDAAIVVSAFAELSELVHRSVKRNIHPQLPDWLINASIQIGGMRADFDPFAIAPLREATVATTPIFFAHGALDKVIPLSHSERLHDAAPEPKVLRVVQKGYHSNVLAEGGDALYQEMIEFCLDLRP